MLTSKDIDWTDPEALISKYFTVQQAIFLHRWNRLANELDGLTDEVKNNLIHIFSILDEIKDRFFPSKDFKIDDAYRPKLYNAKIPGAATHSQHTQGLAIDFNIIGISPINVRKILIPHLEELYLRMETDTPGWTHIGIYETGLPRTFKPK